MQHLVYGQLGILTWYFFDYYFYLDTCLTRSGKKKLASTFYFLTDRLNSKVIIFLMK